MSKSSAPKGMLQRASTFWGDDNRRVQKKEEGFKPLKKALTFIDGKGTSTPDFTFSKKSEKVSYDEVLYRRYFGFENSTEDVGVMQIPPFIQKRNRALTISVNSAAEAMGKGWRQKCVVVVDTFSTGAMVAFKLFKDGYNVIRVLSGDLEELLEMVPEGLDELEYFATYTYNTALPVEEALLALIHALNRVQLPIEAVIPGGETGVELADQLAEKLGLRNNGTVLSEARRNKYVMGETIRNAGIRAVKQLRCSLWGEIEAFLVDWNPNPYKVIVKPLDSAGSDDVTLCNSLDEVKIAYGNIMGKVNGLGLVNRAVLVQEYLEGQEYVIDMVSRDGEHKCVAIWAYDRRAANGAPFVCFGQRALTMDEPHCEELVAYQLKVITALGIKHGATHGEVKWCRGEPVLIEVGARCHGGDGLWLPVANEVYGFNQVDGTVDAFLHPEKFALIPAKPYERKAYGAMKWLVNTMSDGILTSIDPKISAELIELSSHRRHQYFRSAGDTVELTRNCFSWLGSFSLANADKDTLEQHYSVIENCEHTNLFHIAPDTKPKFDGENRVRVAVVDPFSTGATLAHTLCSRGIGVVAVYSASMEQLASLQGLIPKGLILNFDAVVPFEAEADMIAKIGRVDAVIPGAETGVELADQLAEKLGLRNNGTVLSEARRNKYVMGETIRNAGIRAVKQLRSSSITEIEAFLIDWNPNPYKVIVKPLDSAGSDDVTLCNSLDEVKSACKHIMGKVNGLGLVNRAVLVQEYLEGQEYVIDMVSRDGEHKCVAIWAYDRRAANGAGFVCFGQRLLTMDEPHCEELVVYQLKVITALGIKHGATHGEVKWCRGEPVLIEVGARCHGGEGAWVDVASGVYGYNQMAVTIDSYFDGDAFASIPQVPAKRYGHGHMLWLVHHKGGIFQKLNAEMAQEIDAMGAVLDWNIFPNPGDRVSPTTNCFTWGGLVIMFHVDRAHIEADYARIRELELNGLFEITEDAVPTTIPTTVPDITAKLGSLSTAVQTVFANTTINVNDIVDSVFGTGKVTSLTDNQAGVILDNWTVKFEIFLDKTSLKVTKPAARPTA